MACFRLISQRMVDQSLSLLLRVFKKDRFGNESGQPMPVRKAGVMILKSIVL